ncbi:MAG: lipopolysaccharide core heptose(I) kinase RfaP [Gammaproteobacteria bacterium]
MMVLDTAFQSGFQSGENLFDTIMQLQGEVFREMDGRRTLRFQHAGKSYFAKLHFGVGWKEIWKNLRQFKRPVIDAKNEWRAIQRLNQLQVDTMHLVGYGSRGLNPAKRQSFVITEELVNTQSLEDFCQPWKALSPLGGNRLKIKRQLIQRIAWIGKTLHENGVNHRDFYLVHFLLDITPTLPELAQGKITASLIDLHRVLVQRYTPMRWRIKDIGALYFSSLDIGLTKRDIFRFMRAYSGRPLRETLHKDKKFWLAAQARAVKLYNKLYHCDPKAPQRMGFM